MGEKDITEKILEDYNDVFADIINVLVFNGERRIKPEELVNTGVRSMYKADKRKIREQERDIAKLWKECNVELALCGIENQTDADRLMPLRIIGYEGASYRSQYMTKKSTVIPVMTIILYYGEEHWSYNKNLKDIMNIPEGMDEYVNDCKINVFEVSFLSEEQIELFQSDFKIVAKFFVNKRKNKDYVPDDPQTMQHVDELLKLLSVMTGDYRYEELLKNDIGKQVNNMCEVATRLENKGRAEGIAEGIAKMVRNMLSSGMSKEEIARVCKLPIEEVEKIEKMQ